MNNQNGLAWLGFVLSTTIGLSGCASMDSGQQQVAGAGIGAALGCAAGALITGDARGCATGAAIGGAVGWGAVAITQYNARQVRSSKDDSRVFGLTGPVTTPQVKIRQGSSAPETVRAGGSVNISTDYSVLLPPGQSTANVTESWVLKKDGKLLYSLPAKTATRSAGGWEADGVISVPGNAPPGTYVIEHRVKAGSSYDVDQSNFVVKA